MASVRRAAPQEHGARAQSEEDEEEEEEELEELRNGWQVSGGGVA